jgi:nucleotide-binding universal stress UspA family protein
MIMEWAAAPPGQSGRNGLAARCEGRDLHSTLPQPAVGAATAVVLVGIDGSETSWDALSWACGEARRLRGRAVAVFVSSSANSTIAVTALIDAFPFDCGWNEAAATERAETLHREVECYAAGHGVDYSALEWSLRSRS